MKWIEINSRIKKSGIKIFSGSEFGKLAKTSRTSAKFLLIRYTARGLLLRLKRDLYALKDALPSEFAAANRIYRPSYISLESALSFYGLLTDVPYAVTSVTPKPTREYEINGIRYIFRTIKKPAFTGYISASIHGETVWIAEREKAAADYLYFSALSKIKPNERIRFNKLNAGLLKKHVKNFKNPYFERWLNDFTNADT